MAPDEFPAIPFSGKDRKFWEALLRVFLKRCVGVFALCLMLTAFAPAVRAQQSESPAATASPEAATTFDVTLVDQSVTASPGYYTITDSGDVPEYDGKGQFVTFDAEYSSYEAYFYQDDYSAEENLATFQDSIEQSDGIEDVSIIKEQPDGDIAWRLLQVTFDNGNVNIFLIRNTTNYLPDTDLLEVFYAHPDEFGAELDIARQDIKIGDKSVLDGVDIDELQEAIDATPMGTPVSTPAS